MSTLLSWSALVHYALVHYALVHYASALSSIINALNL